MDYIELKCVLKIDIEAARNVLIAELGLLGYESFQEIDEGLLAYIPSNLFNNDAYKNFYCVKNRIFGEIEFSFQIFKEKNWNEYWEKNFKPVKIQNLLIIKAPFHQIKDKFKYEIIMEPKLSFGTGHHATTWLMLSKMLKLDLHDQIILDIGCGTGVLSVFASLKGARKVFGFDNNDWAYNNAIENVGINKCENVKILLGDIKSVEIPSEINIMLANINRNVILQELSLYVKYLKKKGIIIISGILKDNFPEINNEAKKNKLVLKGKKEKDHWLLLEYIKN